ncbi:SCO family protein [Denitromonas iodatirespirans]|uniref:SCO family protein n=1 Tax=Denitromonas iodatirespirans TaxID=2795389 RepID=A0A944DK81_DENI1|nr:SCO family protein [Denitromonas iodatirespirans]MBT0960304.1 SCO family protein [Denitromonas iodatirespirans]
MNEARRRLLLRAGGLLALTLALPSCAEKQEPFQGTDITGVDWGRDFRLGDHTGRPRTLADFRGKAVLLFFGYTHCPDACPTTLAKMARAVELLGEDGARVQGLFVTLDPARDTAAVLGQYVPAFHPDFLGLRGSEAEVARTAGDFKLFFARQAPDASGFYTVDHQAAVLAFDPQGRLRLYFRGKTAAQVIAHDLRILLQ